MVLEGTVDAVARLVLVVGFPVLVALFYLEGLVVGKVLQLPAVFVTVVAVTTPSWPTLAAVSLGCTVSVVAGQWTVYRSFDADSPPLFASRGWGSRIDRLPARAVDRLGDRHLRVVERVFERFGGVGVFVATFLPGVRGVVAIPAGISSYPRRRFLLANFLGNALYFPLLAAVAFGLLDLLGFR